MTSPNLPGPSEKRATAFFLLLFIIIGLFAFIMGLRT